MLLYDGGISEPRKGMVDNPLPTNHISHIEPRPGQTSVHLGALPRTPAVTTYRSQTGVVTCNDLVLFSELDEYIHAIARTSTTTGEKA